MGRRANSPKTMKYDNNDDQRRLWSSLFFMHIVYNKYMGEFQIHKLHLETLGEYLACVRAELGYSVLDVAQRSGVHARFITALESSSFAVLPEQVYVVGFLRKIAGVYAIDAEPLVAEYQRELKLAQDTDVRVAARSWKTIASRLTPRRWAVVVSCLVGALFVGVCLFQVVAIGRVPALSLDAPKQDERVQGGTLLVAGAATPGSEVALNGQIVFVGADGHFASSMSVQPGTQTVEVIARSRFGSQSKKVVTVVVEDSRAAVVGPVTVSHEGDLLANKSK